MNKANKPDNRLALCAGFVRQGVAVADIGTDHAYLPLWLLESGKIRSAVAADIKKGPLARAEKNIKRQSAGDKIALRLSDGLKNISPNEADDIVIAGMGGEVIAGILSGCEWIKNRDKRLILQPMSKPEALLRWLFENGFSVLRQKCALASGRYYTVMLCEYTGEAPSFDESDCYLGALDLSERESRFFMRAQLNRLNMRCRGDKSLITVKEKLNSELEKALNEEDDYDDCK